MHVHFPRFSLVKFYDNKNWEPQQNHVMSSIGYNKVCYKGTHCMIIIYVVDFQKCGREILRYCTHAIFKTKILPLAQKALLRNPEIIVGGKAGFAQA